MSETREVTQEEQSMATGDCYEAAGRLMMDTDNESMVLCHGMVSGQEHLEGVRFGHAWVEVTTPGGEFNGMTFPSFTFVMDNSNGREINLPASFYYNLGDIDPDEIQRYSVDEFRVMAVRNSHWGPWEDEG